MTELESGKVANEKVTTYKGTDKDGKEITEEVTTNKDTGEVSRKVDGKKAVEKKPTVVQYTGDNGEFIVIKQQEMIINQLKEISFYLRKLVEKEGLLDDEKLKGELK